MYMHVMTRYSLNNYSDQILFWVLMIAVIKVEKCASDPHVRYVMSVCTRRE